MSLYDQGPMHDVMMEYAGRFQAKNLTYDSTVGPLYFEERKLQDVRVLLARDPRIP